MTKIIIASIILAIFSIPALVQEEEPKLNVNAIVARSRIIRGLIDDLDRCNALPVATPVEKEAADSCNAILTEKVNLTPLSVLIPYTQLTRETDVNTAKMGALYNLYGAFLYGIATEQKRCIERGLKEGRTARKGRRR